MSSTSTSTSASGIELEENISFFEISIECQKLPNMDTLSKSDPICVVEYRDPKTKNYREIGRTELINDNLNPKFTKRIIIPYLFETIQLLRFFVIDIDNKKNLKASKSELGDDLGVLPKLSLSSLVVAPNQTLTKPLLSRKNDSANGASIILRGEEIHPSVLRFGPNTVINYSPCKAGQEPDSIGLSISAEHLPVMDFFTRSADPYYTISRVREDSSSFKIHTSETIKRSKNPRWKEYRITVAELCNMDLDVPLLFELYDWDKSSDDDFIGNCQTSARELLTGVDMTLKLTNPEKRKAVKGEYSGEGDLKVTIRKLKASPLTFLSHIQAGLEICLSIAVDFTGSNGNPNTKTSLHSIQPGVPNQYESAMGSVPL